jgi:hypothetical protein
MARIAVFEPDDDRTPREPRFRPSPAEREILFADLTGRRLQVRHVDGELVASISHPLRAPEALRWLAASLSRR